LGIGDRRCQRHPNADGRAAARSGLNLQLTLEDADPLTHARKSKPGVIDSDRIEADAGVGDDQENLIAVALEADRGIA
jgi:hypothetical protein